MSVEKCKWMFPSWRILRHCHRLDLPLISMPCFSKIPSGYQTVAWPAGTYIFYQRFTLPFCTRRPSWCTNLSSSMFGMCRILWSPFILVVKYYSCLNSSSGPPFPPKQALPWPHREFWLDDAPAVTVVTNPLMLNCGNLSSIPFTLTKPLPRRLG